MFVVRPDKIVNIVDSLFNGCLVFCINPVQSYESTSRKLAARLKGLLLIEYRKNWRSLCKKLGVDTELGIEVADIFKGVVKDAVLAEGAGLLYHIVRQELVVLDFVLAVVVEYMEVGGVDVREDQIDPKTTKDREFGGFL